MHYTIHSHCNHSLTIDHKNNDVISEVNIQQPKGKTINK